MKLIFNRRVFEGGRHYARGCEYEIGDPDFAASLVRSRRAMIVDPNEPVSTAIAVLLSADSHAPVEVPDEVPAVTPDADVPVGEASDPEVLACPYGCQGGKPYATQSSLDRHVRSKH